MAMAPHPPRTPSLQERVARMRDDPLPGQARSPPSVAASWWGTRNDAMSQLDSVLADLGLSPSQRRQSPRGARRRDDVAGPPNYDSMRPGRASDRAGAGAAPIHLELKSDWARTEAGVGERASMHRSQGFLSVEALEAASCEKKYRTEETGLSPEGPMQRRLEVLQAQNEQLAQHVAEQEQATKMLQLEIRMLQGRVGQRTSEAWIEGSRWSTQGSPMSSLQQRDGWTLHENDPKAKAHEEEAATARDLRQAQAIADEISTREREVRSRLVRESQKVLAARNEASSVQLALDESNKELAQSQAQIQLLRQQLHQALLDNQEIAGDLTKSRAHARSTEDKVIVLEQRLHEALAIVRKKDRELQSLHSDRLLQLDKMHYGKMDFEMQSRERKPFACEAKKELYSNAQLKSPQKRERPERTEMAPAKTDVHRRAARVAWEDTAISAPVDMHTLHANGKELSGFSLRRALKALGQGFSLTLSAVDLQVQRQLLLGVSARGVPNCSIVALPLHTALVKQGEMPHHMFVILRGRVKIWRSRSGSSAGLRRRSQSPTINPRLEKEAAVSENQRHRPLIKPEDAETVLTECMGEVTEGCVLLEAEAALGIASPYTAMVAMPSPGDCEGGPAGAMGDDSAAQCEMLSVTGEALSGQRKTCA